MNTYQQHEALRARRIDLGIARAPLLEPGYATECLVREPFVLAVPSGHKLANATEVSVADLDKQPFLMYSHEAYPPFNELLTGTLRSARVAPDYVQWLGSSLTILALVNAGMGLALVPRCATSVVFRNVVFREIDLGEFDSEPAASNARSVEQIVDEAILCAHGGVDRGEALRLLLGVRLVA